MIDLASEIFPRQSFLKANPEFKDSFSSGHYSIYSQKLILSPSLENLELQFFNDIQNFKSIFRPINRSDR